MAPSGATALYDAVVYALAHVKRGEHQKKALVLISDGGDTASHHGLKETLKLAKRSEAIIYSIGLTDLLGRDQNPKVLKQFSRMTGGESFFPDQASEIQEACERIGKDIRNQYTLGYRPSNTKLDGKYRRVQVTVSSPHHKHLVCRTREGYFAPSEPSSLKP
jgi:Ca-activated chloride channel family protein